MGAKGAVEIIFRHQENRGRYSHNNNNNNNN
jgi:hypothetical protein